MEDRLNRPSFTTGLPTPTKVSAPRSKFDAQVQAVLTKLLRFARDYVYEWKLTDARKEKVVQARADALVAAIQQSDAVVFVKPGGLCPFCNLATSIMLAEHKNAMQSFTLHVADLLAEDREALSDLLKMPLLTWPVIFFRGQMLPGGGEGLAKLQKQDGALVAALNAPRIDFSPPPIHVPKYPQPLLLHQAGGGAWTGCQQRIYGNVLRGIAVLQIALLWGAHELERNDHTLETIPILVFLAVDSLLFTLSGPTPWSPLGCLATLILWHRRGSVAPLLPYKVTFLGLYFLMNVSGLTCRLVDLANRAEAGGSGERVGGFCDLVNSDGLTWTMLTNSAALAIFRF